MREPHAPNLVDYAREGRIYLESTIEIGRIKFQIGTTHMSYAHRFEPSAERIEEDSKLLKLLEDKYNFIFAGDLNTHPKSKLVNSLCDRFQHAGPDFDVNTCTTKPFDYNGFQESEFNWRLDYVFATENFKFLSAKTINTDTSDHLPIFVKFEF